MAGYQRFFPLILLALGFAGKLFAAIPPPKIECLAIDEAGNARITWEIPPDSDGEFQQYQIYHRSAFTDPFVMIGQVNDYLTDTILLIGDFCGEGSFYMAVVYDEGTGPDTSAASNITGPIQLEAFAVDEVVQLSWNPLNLPGTGQGYIVYHMFPNGSWQQRATVPWGTTSYIDSVDACNDTLTYKIEFVGSSGCINSSCQEKVYVVDAEAPDITDLISASVDTANGNVLLEWSKSTSPDVFGYLLTYFSEFRWRDTIYGGEVTGAVYQKDQINANIRPETLSVAPFDSCFNSGTEWYNQAADNLRFQTLFLEITGADVCGGAIDLQWNRPANGFPTGVEDIDRYLLYSRQGGGQMQPVATLTTTDSTFRHEGLESGHVYTYMLVAENDSTGARANSNLAAMDLVPPKQPGYLYIKSIQNNFASGENEVMLAVDPDAEVDNYALYRAMKEAGPYQLVRRDYDTIDSNVIIEDETGMAGQSSFYYQVAAIDICGDEVAYSNIARSIHLAGSKEEIELLVHLNWNGYEGWASTDGSDQYYRLVRVLNGQEADAGEGTALFAFTDQLNDVLNISGEICYYVVGEESHPDTFGFQEKAKSNKLCFVEEPRIYVPNAFSPDDDDINDIFLPVVNYVDQVDYEMVIWNRRGQKVFQTKDPTVGWNGHNAPPDVYAYQIFLRNARDELIEARGKVVLVR